MPVNVSDPYLRLAIWEAYAQRCPYCTRLVEYESFQVDHIVPHAIIKDPARLALLAASVGLPVDFDYEGMGNLIMSCRPCNRLKSGGPQEDGDLRYTLGRAARRIPEIEARYKAALDAMQPPTKEELSSQARGNVAAPSPDSSKREIQ